MTLLFSVTDNFGPEAINKMDLVFKLVRAELDDELTDANRQRVCDVIAQSILRLAKIGQTDTEHVAAYALDKAREALSQP